MDTDFDWQLENPTVALEKYYENIELFKEKKEENATVGFSNCQSKSVSIVYFNSFYLGYTIFSFFDFFRHKID